MQRAITILLSAFLLLSLQSSGSKDAPFKLIENAGQWPAHVHARTTVASSHFWLEEKGFTYQLFDFSPIEALHGTTTDMEALQGTSRLRGHVFKAQFTASNPNAEVTFDGAQRERFNFFLGNDAENWRSDVSAWTSARYHDLYPGIDLEVYIHDRALKYDLLVEAGSDPSIIEVQYDGVESLRIENGRLIMVTSVGEVTEQVPVAWQDDNGERKRIDCRFFLNGDRVQFIFPDGYDPQLPITIDPVLIFSTYSGSTANNFGFTATFDEEGYLYAGSIAFGEGYPVTTGAFQQTWAGGDGQLGLVGTDIAITKYELDGTDRIYSTYLGGSNDELPHSLIVNGSNELIVMGTTSSPDFPITAGAPQTDFNGGSLVAPSGVGVEYVNGADLIVTKFNESGTALTSSTFLGGSANDGVNSVTNLRFNYADEFRGEIELDSQDNIYIASCTFSSDFPTVNAWQENYTAGLEGCIVKYDAELSSVLYSTYYGSGGDEGVYSLAVCSNDDIYVCGGTTSNTLPMTGSPYQPNYGGGTADGFVSRFSADGSAQLQSTYLGATVYDQLYFIDVDSEDIAHVYGQTLAPGVTFIINADYGTPDSGMLLAKFNEDLSGLNWSTVFGTGNGTCNLSPTAFLVDVCGKIYLSGWGGNTNSNPQTGFTTGMDITPDAYQSSTDGSDFYLMVIEDDASDIVFGSFFGGGVSSEHVDGGTSRFNRKGQIYQSVCAGCGGNSDFPIFPSDAVGPINNSSCNNGIFKFDFQLPISVADFFADPEGCVNSPVQFQNNSTTYEEIFWDFGDGVTSGLDNPIHNYDEPGTYEIMLVVTNPETCNISDTLYRTIDIQVPQSFQQDAITICQGESAVIGPENIDPELIYEWLPPVEPVNADEPQTEVSPESTTEYTQLITTDACVDTLLQTVEVIPVDLTVSDDVLLCGPGETITMTASSSASDATFTWATDPDFANVIASGADATSVDVEITEEGTYYVEVEIDGCTRVEEIEVNFTVGSLDLGPDLVVCAGDTVSISIENSLPGFEVTWSPEDVVLSGQGTSSIQAVVTGPTLIEVVADDGDDCIIEGELFVDASGIDPNQVTATADPDVLLTGESTTLTATPEGFDYTWVPGDSVEDPDAASTPATPSETTTYYLTLSDGECIYTDSVVVRVFDFICGPPSIYVPNAFTPNGDDNNDRLFVRGNNITDLLFVVYNRWGEKVFETTSLSQGWDGTYKGRPADPAVFVYYLEATCAGGETYFEKGNVTLIR